MKKLFVKSINENPFPILQLITKYLGALLVNPALKSDDMYLCVPLFLTQNIFDIQLTNKYKNTTNIHKKAKNTHTNMLMHIHTLVHTLTHAYKHTNRDNITYPLKALKGTSTHTQTSAYTHTHIHTHIYNHDQHIQLNAIMRTLAH